ncbi:hypothetical protein GMB29_14975 [Metabacillus sediminilitoris]|jgi:hypothetical protein|nr:hypothetical protein GMB29_14975 [Metabacillus sediminilitoris]
MMEKKRDFPVAQLSETQIDTLVQMEAKLRQETGEDIVLIAYEHMDKS